MTEADDPVLVRTIDWDAVAKAVRVLSSREEEPLLARSGLMTTDGEKKSTNLATNMNNRLSDFDDFDWD